MPVKMSALKIIFFPFVLFFDNLKRFSFLALPYLIVLSLLSFLCGFSYMCIFGADGLGCSNSQPLYVIYSIIRYVLIIMFAAKSFQFIYKKEEITVGNIFSFGKKEAVTLGLLTLFLVINSAPMLSSYILYIRVPNPNWVVELIFFSIVSIGFLIPFVAMRFYSLIGFAVEGEKLPLLKEVWQRSNGNNLKIILGLFLILMFIIFVLINFYTNFQNVTGGNIVYIGIVAEVLYNLCCLIIILLLTNHCLIQKTLLFKGDNND